MSGKQQKAQGNAVVSPPRRCRNLYDLDQWGAQAGFEVLPISSSFAGLTDRAWVMFEFWHDGYWTPKDHREHVELYATHTFVGPDLAQFYGLAGRAAAQGGRVLLIERPGRKKLLRLLPPPRQRSAKNSVRSEPDASAQQFVSSSQAVRTPPWAAVESSRPGSPALVAAIDASRPILATAQAR